MARLDVLPLTRLLDIPHMCPSPTMTLASLRASCDALERDIESLKVELRLWKRVALSRRELLRKSGINIGENWEEEDRRGT